MIAHRVLCTHERDKSSEFDLSTIVCFKQSQEILNTRKLVACEWSQMRNTRKFVGVKIMRVTVYPDLQSLDTKLLNSSKQISEYM